MLNVIISQRIPDEASFILESFKEISRAFQDATIRIISIRTEWDDAKEGWSEFIKSLNLEKDDRAAIEHLWQVICRQVETGGMTVNYPPRCLYLEELVAQPSGEMLRGLMEELSKITPINNLGELFSELGQYSLQVENVRIFDKYICRIWPRDLFKKNTKDSRKNIVKKLAIICKALCPPPYNTPPSTIEIITELINPHDLVKLSRFGSDYDNLPGYLSSKEYLDSSEEIVRQTIEELRDYFPTLRNCTFVIHDCSSLSSGDQKMMHDRFMFFNATSIVSSYGFSHKMKWPVNEIASKLSDSDSSSYVSDKFGPSYLLPVRAPEVRVPNSSTKITISRA